MEDKELLKSLVSALEDKKAEAVKVIDITGLSVMTDYFVITNAANQPQMDALTDFALEAFAKAGVEEVKVEGNSASGWILMDAANVILHIFSREARDFYNLERIWKDGKEVNFSSAN